MNRLRHIHRIQFRTARIFSYGMYVEALQGVDLNSISKIIYYGTLETKFLPTIILCVCLDFFSFFFFRGLNGTFVCLIVQNTIPGTD